MSAQMRSRNKLKGGGYLNTESHVSSCLGKVLGQVASGKGDLPPGPGRLTTSDFGCGLLLELGPGKKWGLGGEYRDLPAKPTNANISQAGTGCAESIFSL